MSTREPCFTLVVTGASGAGKTAAVRALAARALSVSTAIENGALSAIENGTLRSGVTDP